MSETSPRFGEENAWQRFCTETLMKAIRLPKHQRAQGWSDARKSLIRLANDQIADEKQRRIIIADADLRNQHLEDFNFSYCYIIRTDFKGANLRNSKFSYAIIRDGTLNDANANGANFEHADIKDTAVETLQYNSATKLNFSRFQPREPVPTQLDDRVSHDRNIASSRNAPPFNRLLNLLTGHGFGIGRLLLSSCALVFLFALIFRFLSPQNFAIGAGTVKVESLTFWNFLLFSAERFLNASPWIYGVSDLSHLLAAFETLIGLFALSLLVAMLVRQVVRPR